MSRACSLLIALAAAIPEGRPLFYWGSRPPVIGEGKAGEREGPEAAVTEVHAALDRGALVLRVAFDRAVHEAMYLPDGSPVSGRLRAILYIDVDDDRKTGADQGPLDLRTGADRRLEIGVVSVGEDEEEKRGASATLTVTLASLSKSARRHTLWRGDDTKTPGQVSAHAEFVEVRLPPDPAIRGGSRIILVDGDGSRDGRLAP
jgi:hypothetical protein